MTVPIAYAVWGMALTFGLGMFVDRCLKRPRVKWPRFDRDLRGPVLSGASDAYFRHDLSDTKEIG